MVLRMTGARKPSLAMSDAEHVGYVHLLGQQRTGDFRGQGMFCGSLLTSY